MHCSILPQSEHLIWYVPELRTMIVASEQFIIANYPNAICSNVCSPTPPMPEDKWNTFCAALTEGLCSPNSPIKPHSKEV